MNLLYLSEDMLAVVIANTLIVAALCLAVGYLLGKAAK